MKTLKIVFLFLLPLIFFNCSKDDVRPARAEYSFRVYSIDNTQFTATVKWGVRVLEETKEVTASSFGARYLYLSVGTNEFVISVDVDNLYVVISNNDTGENRIFPLKKGETLKVKGF